MYHDRRTSPRSVLDNHLSVVDDFKATMHQLQRRHPSSDIYAISISYGTSVLVNYMAQMQEKSIVKAGVAVSSPFDFWKSKVKIETDHYNFYEKFIVKQYRTMLKSNYQDWKNSPSELKLDIDHVLEMGSLDELDERFHRTVVGKSVPEFYNELSLLTDDKIPRIARPFLFLQSHDDPFCDNTSLPTHLIANNPHLLFAMTKRGSHVAWWTGNISPDRVSPLYLTIVV